MQPLCSLPLLSTITLLHLLHCVDLHAVWDFPALDKVTLGPGLQTEGYLWAPLSPRQLFPTQHTPYPRSMGAREEHAVPRPRTPITSLLLQAGGHSTLNNFGCLPNLILLEIRGLVRCDNIEGLEGAPLLTSLTIEENPVLRSIRGLEGLKGLRNLSLQGCPKVTLPDAILALTILRDLKLGGINIPSLLPLLALHELTSLDISFSQGLHDVSALSSLPALRHLKAHGLLETYGWASFARCNVEF